MNCPRCGENNPDNYKFCGMCGTNLQTASEAEKPAAKASSETSQPSPVRAQSMAFSRMESRGSAERRALTMDEPRPARAGEPHEPVEPIAGPSLLGLNQPTPETIRETTFRGMTTYYPEERHPAWGRILLTLIFIVGLVALGWWRYKNYGLPGHGTPGWLSAMNKTNPPSDNQAPEYGAKPAAPGTNQNTDQTKNQGADQSKAASGETTNADSQSGDSATAADKAKGGAEQTPDKTADSKSADSSKTSDKSADSNTENESDAGATAKPAKAAKAAKPSAADDESSAPAAKIKPAAASAEGDGLFRRGEAYLYGRGVAESCSQAIRYLKSASDKSSAKARSTFGTMYATGHCVPRDLPTSYRWFAMALQADPNNSILEKDLGAIWNQMTPPERQLATKLKPNGE